MIPDPTAEIKRIRHQLGADDGFDLDRIFARIRRVQAESGRKCIRRPSRKPANHAIRIGARLPGTPPTTPKHADPH
jgi:hypothetical protein